MSWFRTLLVCALASQVHGLLRTDPIEGSTPIAVLDYGTFQGAYDPMYNISYFKSIPFAAPPTGNLRFRAPQLPLKYEGVFDSSVTKDFCVQRTVNGSEDCLYLELYGRRFNPKAKKPVLVKSCYFPKSIRDVLRIQVWLYGGGYVQGGGSTSWPPFVYPTLKVSTLNDFIVVLPNYRVNSFGFLSGQLIKDDPTTDLNVGLLDQQAALKWVQKVWLIDRLTRDCVLNLTITVHPHIRRRPIKSHALGPKRRRRISTLARHCKQPYVAS